MPGGLPPLKVPELARVQDRTAFLYLEHCVVHRDGNALTARDDRGTVHIPAATLAALLLGPGTSISHQAMSLIAECASTVVWVGEMGVRYYAHGRSLARGTRLLEAQARLVSNRTTRLETARRMYALRFPGEDVSLLTMQQLRGREGARVREVYRSNSVRTGVSWRRRDYDPQNFEGSDAINQALSAAHSALYGLVHAVIVSLGCAPGLGFVHTGHERSFVYDIADLYKAETSIPVAFDVVAEGAVDVGSATRRAMRDAMFSARLIERAVSDIRTLLDPSGESALDADGVGAGVVSLWDERRGAVAAGVNYEDVDW